MISITTIIFVVYFLASHPDQTSAALPPPQDDSPITGNVYPRVTKTFIVVGDDNYPPYSYLQNGQPTGFNVDIIHAAAHAVGADVEIRLMPWNKAVQTLMNGEADLILGMAYSPEHTGIYEFSTPIATVSFDIFVRQNSDIRQLSDLTGKKVLFQRSDVVEDYLPSLAEDILPVPVMNPIEALRTLSSGEYDAAIVSRLQGYYIANQNKLTNIKASNLRILPLDYSFAALKKNSDVIMDLNEGLSILKSSGEYQALSKKWFGLYEEQSFWEQAKYYFYGVAVILAFGFAGAGWLWSLRRQVKIKTHDLVTSENKYRELVENISEAVIITVNKQVIFTNKQVEHLFEMPADEFNPGNFKDMIHPGSLDKVITEFSNWQYSIEKRISSIFCVNLPSGKEKWVKVICEKIDWDDQQAILNLFLDITQEKTTQLALAESELKFRTAFESAAVGLVISGVDGKLLQVNDTFCNYMGYSREELNKKNWREITHPDDILKNVDALQDVEGNRKTVSLEKRYIRKDGALIWADLSTALMKAPDGQPLYYISYVQNITDKKAAEEKLRESEKRFRTIFETASVSLWEEDFSQVIQWIEQKKNEGITNFNSYFDSHPAAVKTLSEMITIRDVNETALKMYRSNSKKELCRSLDKIFCEESLPNFKKEILALANGQSYFEGETVNRTLSGEKITVLITTNIPVQSRDYTRLMVSLTDITRLKKAEERIRQQVQHLAALRSVDMAISASMDMQITLRVLLAQVKQQLTVDAVAILLLNPHTQMLEYAAGTGFKTRAIENIHLRMGQSYAGRAALERRTIMADDLNNREDTLLTTDQLFAEQYVYFVGIPLIAKGAVKGVLELFSYSPFSSEAEWINLLEAMASQAAIAIDNATLFDDVQRANTNLILAYDATIEGWARALELRDGETEGHSKRVTDLTTALAATCGFHDEDLIHIRRGAFLHDIGKMGIPDSILLKPGPLTDDEWKVMKMHPVWGKQLLQNIDFLKPAINIPYCHHEKWDGTGYPQGLKGEDIPLSARIFSIVDGYDALSSDRPYRKAWSKEKVVAYLQENAGKAYDPEVMDRFLKLII